MSSTARRFAPLLFCLTACAGAPTSLSATSQGLSGTPWPRHSFVDGSAACAGADGTDEWIDPQTAELWVVTGCEQSSTVWAWRSSTGTAAQVGTSVSVEDVKWADLDGDGLPEDVSAGQGKTVKIDWPNGTHTTIAGATNEQQWMSLALVDIDDDGDTDIIAGGRRAAYPPAHIKGWRNPGGAAAHNGALASWPEFDVGLTGLTISIFGTDADHDGDMDLVVSEREWVWTAGNGHDTSQAGVRLISQVAGTTPTWSPTMIQQPAHGDQKMIALGDFDGDEELDIVTASSNATWNLSAILLNSSGDFSTWSQIDVPQPTGVGQVHGVAIGLVDGDEDPDLVFTYAEAYAPDEAGVVHMQNNGDGSFTAYNVSGDDGDKFDDVQLIDVDHDGDFDPVTSEQHKDGNLDGKVGPGQGAEWFENQLNE